MAFWGSIIKSGQDFVLGEDVDGPVHISAAVLTKAGGNSSEAVQVIVNVDSHEYVVASLKNGSCQQVPLDIMVGTEPDTILKITGKDAEVHLTGYVELGMYDGYSDDDEDMRDDDRATTSTKVSSKSSTNARVEAASSDDDAKLEEADSDDNSDAPVDKRRDSSATADSNADSPTGSDVDANEDSSHSNDSGSDAEEHSGNSEKGNQKPAAKSASNQNQKAGMKRKEPHSAQSGATGSPAKLAKKGPGGAKSDAPVAGTRKPAAAATATTGKPAAAATKPATSSSVTQTKGSSAAGEQQYEKDLIQFLKENKHVPLSALGAKVKKPADVKEKLGQFIKDRPKVFQIKNNEVLLVKP